MKLLAALTLFVLLTLSLPPVTWSYHFPEADQPNPASPAALVDLTVQHQVATGEFPQPPQSAAPPSFNIRAAKSQVWESEWDRKVHALGRSLVAGLSTSVGAGAVLWGITSPTAAHMAFCLSLAAGVMVTVSLLELFLPRIWEPGWRLQAIFFSSLGVLAFWGLSKLVPEPEYTKEVDEEMATDDKDKDEIKKGKQWRLAMLMMLALTAHNFPEGLAVAAASMHDERLGFVVMAAIAVHNIPEGIAIAMPVFDATKSRMKAMQMATLSGLAEPLGALVALTMLPPEWLEGRGMDGLLCLVGGIMVSVACTELFPEAIALHEPTAVFVGTVVGVIVMLLTMSLV